ncbi:MAG: aldo/keto reductase, partial [Bacteroidales bacterium]|nr:aldo/keto reductase [Bacteroidales bacterium]
MKRRDFIKSSAAAAAAAVAACTPREQEGGAGTGTKGRRGAMLQNYEGIGTLGYGCMRWPMTSDGNGGEIIDQQEVNRLVDEALAAGVNYYDTSPVYLKGESERATAEALCRHPRESWLLATKLSNFSNFSYENSVKMYRRSLEIFNT